MPASATPTLQLDLRLAATDLFGAMEWVLANARRTGLALQHLSFDATARHRLNATLTAADTDLLHLFVRRLGNGTGVEVLMADFGDDDLDEAPDSSPAGLTAFMPAVALHA